MRYPLLIALREFAENAKTKGFWIGLLLFPVMLVVMIQVPRFLEERATPTRYFTIVDQSARFEPVILQGVERAHARRVLEALVAYQARYADPDRLPQAGDGGIDLEDAPPGSLNPAEVVKRLAEDNPEMLDTLQQPDGLALVLAGIRPLLVADAPPFEEPRRRLRKVEIPAGVDPSAGPDQVGEALKPYLRGEERVEVGGESKDLFAAVVIPADVEEHIIRPGTLQSVGWDREGVRFWSANLADDDLRDVVKNSIDEHIRAEAYEARGMPPAAVREIERTSVAFATFDPKKAAGEEVVSLADEIRLWVPVGFVYLLWIAIFTVAQMLLNNTVEEKSNRIIEVLLSSVTPGELMMGKLVGIAAVGLTMIAAWCISLIGVVWYFAGPEAEFAQHLLDILADDRVLIPAFACYFVFGYLMYAGIFLAIGSVCNTLKEAQNFMGPVTLILMVPLLTMMFIPKDPNGTLAVALSWIPLYTPFIMMNRIAGDPPQSQLIGTLALMVVSALGMLWLSGKIFRIGILRTGQPPKLLELLRWLRSS
ncbi:MAG: hypothetical protein EYC70_06010 [Planctomycetota bacterium]|nr:MAG: hypothetical protein EYC70_06010 [Planctomycetota bacterium]